MKELQVAPGLLVSMPHLADPNFTRAVVLMIEHDDEGSFGLVINQPSDIPLSSLLGALDIERRGSDRETVWTGGPVMPTSGWVIHDAVDEDSLATDLQEGLSVGASVRAGPKLALSASPEKLRAVAENTQLRSRFLLGYSGWGPGQLAAEMSQGSWLHADVTRELVFDIEPAQMWHSALQSIGVDPEAVVLGRGVH